jgi:hypothetical protein
MHRDLHAPDRSPTALLPARIPRERIVHTQSERPALRRGIEVFDLGEMRGANMVVRDIRVVAMLLGHPERGQRLASS